MLVQERDVVLEAHQGWPNDGLRVVTRRQPTAEEWQALRFAWRICAHVKSNTVIFTSADRTLAIGAGQMSRVDAVNVATMSRNGLLKDPRILEFGSNGFILSQVAAASAQTDDGHWTLVDVERQEYDTRGPGEPRIVTTKIPMLEWPTSLTTEMVSVALLRPERMRTLDLFEYIQHLEANGQTAQRYEIEFWRKVFYPLSCLVMVVLALPFAYLHFRQAGITTYVFGGVMIGISFFLLNNVFGYLGNLGNWWPWITAAAPGLIYSVMSLAAFSWLVLRR